jgi:hypothetical protein
MSKISEYKTRKNVDEKKNNYEFDEETKYIEDKFSSEDVDFIL